MQPKHRLLFFLAMAGALIALLAIRYPFALYSQDSRFHLVYWLILLVVVGRGVFVSRHAPISKLLRDLGIWIMLLLVLVALYAYRSEVSNSRFAAALIPARPIMNEENNVVITAAEDGHFYVEARVNGVPVYFMADTGATDIVLSPKDAESLGFSVDSIIYSRQYETANGIGKGADIQLDSLDIGDISMHDLKASVNQADMPHSLLGMSFFRKLRSFQVEGDSMTLVQ